MKKRQRKKNIKKQRDRESPVSGFFTVDGVCVPFESGLDFSYWADKSIDEVAEEFLEFIAPDKKEQVK